MVKAEDGDGCVYCVNHSFQDRGVSSRSAAGFSAAKDAHKKKKSLELTSWWDKAWSLGSYGFLVTVVACQAART